MVFRRWDLVASLSLQTFFVFMVHVGEVTSINNDRAAVVSLSHSHSKASDPFLLQKERALAKRHNLIAKATDERLHGDLGEALGKDKKVSKFDATVEQARAKVTEKIKLLDLNNQKSVEDANRIMNEKVQKANIKRSAVTQKAMQMMNNAPEKWKSIWDQQQAQNVQQWGAIREKGTKFLQELQSKLSQKRQKRTAYWMSQISSMRSMMSKFEEKQKAWYMKQLSVYDQSRSAAYAEAESNYAAESANLKTMSATAQATASSQSTFLQSQSSQMIKEAMSRKAQAYVKLKALESEALASVQARVQAAAKKAEADAAKARDVAAIARAKAQGKMKQSEEAKASWQDEKDMLRKFEDEYKAKLAKLKLQKTQTSDKITSVSRQELGEIKTSIQNIDKAAADRVTKALSKEGAQVEKVKEEQLTWMEKARRNGQANCHDAREAAQMKASAAKFAAQRVARDAQSQMVISKNNWLDAEDKARQLSKKKDFEATKLKEATVAAAVTMAKQLYAPRAGAASDDVPCAESFSMEPDNMNPSKIPDEDELERVSANYAKAYIPLDQEEAVATERDKVRKQAHVVAMRKTRVWAHNHALKVAREADAEATKECADSQKWFADVEATAKSQLGEVSDDKVDTKKKLETSAKTWATTHLQMLLARKQNITNAIDAELAGTDKQFVVQKDAIDTDYNTRAKDIRKKANVYDNKYQELKAQAELDLKLTQDRLNTQLKEAQRLRDITDKEAEKIKTHAEARTVKQKLQIDADTDRSIERQKLQLQISLNELKQSTAQASGAGTAAQQEQAEALKKQKEMLEAKAESLYKSRTQQAENDSSAKTQAEKASVDEKISKYKLDLKSEMSSFDEQNQKAIEKEKAAQTKIDQLRKIAKEKGQKKGTRYSEQVEEEAQMLLRQAANAEHVAINNAKAELEEKMKHAESNEAQKITVAKNEVIAEGGQTIGVQPTR